MRILFVGCLTKNKAGNIYGGAEKSLINLSNWMAINSNHEVYLCSVEGDVCAYPLDSKVKFLGYKMKDGLGKLRTHMTMCKNTYEAVEKIKPDIIVGFWIHPLFYLSIHPRYKKIPLIYSERNDPALDYGKVSRFMRSFLVHRTKGNVFQTNDACSFFDKDVQKKSRIIHNPVYIGIDKYPIYNDGNKRIVTVGRLNKQKNQALLIKVFSHVVKEFPQHILEIYGEGPLRNDLNKLIEELNLCNKVKLMGAYPDVLDRIHGADLFVLSSLYEGMPNALLEAMSLGIPVLSTDCPCGGPKEVIQQGINGFLCNVNDEDDMYEKICNILNMDQNKIESLCINEKKICETHSENEIFSNWLEYMEECFNDR